MKNYVQEGCVLEVVSAAPVESGSVVSVGSLLGVAQTAAAEAGETLTVSLKGVYELPKAAGVAITQGGKVYYDSGNSEVTDTDNGGANAFLGYGWAEALAADTTALVLLSRPGE